MSEKRFPIIKVEDDGTERVVAYRAEIERRLLGVTFEKNSKTNWSAEQTYTATVKNEYNTQRLRLTDEEAVEFINRLDEVFEEFLGRGKPVYSRGPGKVSTHF